MNVVVWEISRLAATHDKFSRSIKLEQKEEVAAAVRNWGGGGGPDTYMCVTQFANHAIKRWGYYFLHEHVYSSRAFQNTSSACNSSNTHSIIIAPILLGVKAPPTEILGGAIAPLAPLCRRPCSRLADTHDKF